MAGTAGTFGRREEHPSGRKEGEPIRISQETAGGCLRTQDFWRGRCERSTCLEASLRRLQHVEMSIMG